MEEPTFLPGRSQETHGSIMIVDDTPENLRMLETMLQQHGYVVRPAPNGFFALKSIQSAFPDLILLDIMMPGIDGYEVCRRLKADERTRHIPVIFLSALHEKAGKIKAFQVGGIDYITKPFQPEEVLARVETHLALQQARMQLEERNAELLRANRQLAHEVDERQRAQNALRRSHDELEIRVAQRTAELAESNKALQESEQAARIFQEKLKALHEFSVQLSEADNVDELCRRSIIFGQSALEFERLGLFLLDEAQNSARGTFGIDAHGQLRDERDLRFDVTDDPRFVQVLRTKDRGTVWHDTPLLDNWQKVGRGWNAMAALWVGERAIGWLAADNLLSQKPLAPYELELLSLYAAAIGHFITRKYDEENLAQLKQAIEFMQLGLTITDLDGIIVYTNQAEADMHDYQVEELLGRRSCMLAPEELQVPFVLRDVERWHGMVRESVNIRKDGNRFPVRLMSEVVRGLDGHPCAIITSCEDITERKALEAEREKYRSRLEELVKERTRELTTTNMQLRQEIRERQRAEEELLHAKEAALEAKHAAEADRRKAENANRAKSQFLANMNHELRTPLNSILGFSQLLAHHQNLNAEQQEYIEIINRSGKHLLTLVNQVLDLSKIEADRMGLDVNNFDLYYLLNELEHMFRLRAQRKHVQLEFHCAPDVSRYIRADEMKLRQVLINLLNNGIKFTEKGTVQLSVANAQYQENAEYRLLPTAHCSLNTDNCLQFTVEDTGSGIEADELQHIFDAFVQTKTGQSSQEGTGLGLTICQKFVHLMGGAISVSSRPDEGTIFTFIIPVRAVDSHDVDFKHATRRVIAVEPNQARYRILLVDENQDSRHLLVNMLRPLGFDLQEAENGRKGIRSWEQWKPHLILMGMRMPLMDGYEATRQIRAIEGRQQWRARTPIIAITASTSEKEHADILAAGCDGFLVKPLHDTAIFETIRRHLHLRWIYEGEEQNEEPVLSAALIPEALATLSSELLEELKQVALRLNVEMIDQTLQIIRHDNRDLADFLLDLANEFRYDQILALIQEAQKLKKDA